MEAIIFLLAFLLGLSAGALTVFLTAKAPSKTDATENSEAYENSGLLSQYINFLKYDGTERGQKDER